MEILFLIVARAGSKGIPNKNLQEIGGLSLIGYKAKSALRSASCARLMISTDCANIRRAASMFGAEAPFLRPAELATDTAATVDVVAHAIDWIEANEGRSYDAIMLLEPSSPFARASDYEAAVEIMDKRGANVVLGVKEVETNTCFAGCPDGESRLSELVCKIRALKSIRRQDQPLEVTPNGCLYLFGWEYFKRHRAIYADPENTFGHLMDSYHSIEIDSPIQLEWARFLADSGRIDLSDWQ